MPTYCLTHIHTPLPTPTHKHTHRAHRVPSQLTLPQALGSPTLVLRLVDTHILRRAFDSSGPTAVRGRVALDLSHSYGGRAAAANGAREKVSNSAAFRAFTVGRNRDALQAGCACVIVVHAVAAADEVDKLRAHVRLNLAHPSLGSLGVEPTQSIGALPRRRAAEGPIRASRGQQRPTALLWWGGRKRG